MLPDRSEETRNKHARKYRGLVQSDLMPVRVVVQESDLCIYSDTGVDSEVAAVAKEALMAQRGYLERYIGSHPGFVQSLVPWPRDLLAPMIVRQMIDAGRRAQVGPMAAVAGALAQQVGEALLALAGEVIVENGGDIFLHTRRDLTVAVYANRSPLSLKVGLRMPAARMPLAVCTSSGTVGHSLSTGRADAVCVVSSSCALADACATAIGNRVHSAADISTAIEWGKSIDGLDGGVVIIGDKMGIWGEIELVPIKKG
jgi:uncharacterized protein